MTRKNKIYLLATFTITPTTVMPASPANTKTASFHCFQVVIGASVVAVVATVVVVAVVATVVVFGVVTGAVSATGYEIWQTPSKKMQPLALQTFGPS